ncbi:DUF6647 family protein [Halovulum marinum]|nr:DUF6647 family protein [Halovulum marinum]
MGDPEMCGFRDSIARIPLAPIAFGLVLSIAPMAGATCISPCTRISDLWDWVGRELRIEGRAPPPRVRVMSPDALVTLYTGQPMRGTDSVSIVALYDRSQQVILLAGAWTPGEPASESIIVHELVHHAQALRGDRYPCLAASETEAYAIQDRWLRRSGQDLETSFGIDAFTLAIRGLCAL